MMNMIDENDRPTRYESMKTWEQQTTILQAVKKARTYENSLKVR